MAMARDGIEHRLLAPDQVCNSIIEKQVETFKRNFVYSGSPHTVVSVDTLLVRADSLGHWPSQVGLAQTDEGHHVLAANKGGRAHNCFPKALRLSWTGTAMRPDRKSLRRGFQPDGTPLTGIYDALVIGPSTADLLAWGYLTPFKIFGPPPSIDMAGALIGDSGDFAKAELSRRAARSSIIGDMLSHYLALAPGRVGIGFCVDVEQAKETAAAFQAAGIPCAWMSSRETNDRVRVDTLEKLRRGDIKLIFNVDLLGEGVDVPRVEVILDGRPTMSLVRYLQVFGRLLRLFPGKEFGIYIDMVGNVMRHGLPTKLHQWTLDVPPKRSTLENDEDALTACTACYQHYSVFLKKCPHCGHRAAVASRGAASRPEQVHGDLTEYSAELLQRLQAEAARIQGPAPRGKVPAYIERNWNTRAVAVSSLVDAINWWCSMQGQRRGLEVGEVYRLFWHRFKTDVATAQTLDATGAVELTETIWKDINRL